MTDKFSKTIVFGNWLVTPDAFDELTVRRWDIVTIDRFASEKNRKIKTKYTCPEILGLDAYTFDRAGKLNWFVPSVCLIGKYANDFCSSTKGCNFSLPLLDISLFSH